jgi:hypothetical protein
MNGFSEILAIILSRASGEIKNSRYAWKKKYSN